MKLEYKVNSKSEIKKIDRAIGLLRKSYELESERNLEVRTKISDIDKDGIELTVSRGVLRKVNLKEGQEPAELLEAAPNYLGVKLGKQKFSLTYAENYDKLRENIGLLRGSFKKTEGYAHPKLISASPQGVSVRIGKSIFAASFYR